MRKICLALCFSLFASLIHAAAMPIELSTPESHQQTLTIDVFSHHCDEAASNTQGNNKQPCHGDSYQCCLGLVFTAPITTLVPFEFSEASVSAYLPLALQPMINFIYKPPKS